MPFVNTIDELGEEETFAQLIKGTISAFADDQISTIRSYVFQSCYNLESVFCPSVTRIYDGAFDGCSKLTTASFPSLSFIGDLAFQSCKISLASFSLVGDLTHAGCFRRCYYLTTATFPLVTAIGRSSFEECTRLTTVSFPMASSIGSYAFRNCYLLSTVMFPNVSHIGGSAFQYCSVLKSVIFGWSSVAVMNKSTAFTGVPSGLTIYVPDSLVTEYQSATNWSYYSSLIKGISELPS